MVFDTYEDFTEFLRTRTSGGDAVDVWSMEDLCMPENRLAEGKVPDEAGCVPEGGAY
jgi:hypothetical protein